MDKSIMIILTYKGKILLMNRIANPNDQERPWSFISGMKGEKEPIEMTMTRRVKKEMGITLSNIEFLSESCYRSELTDDHVNHIERSDGQLLDFYTMKEAEKLELSSDTKEILTKHGSIL